MTTPQALPVFDFYELTSTDDPYPLYAEWRAEGPLVKGGPRQWGVTRHLEVAALLKDRRLMHGMPREYTDFMMGSGPSSEFRQNSLLMIDGPAHQRLRRLMGQAFTPQLVRDLQQRAEALVDGMIAPLLDGARVNLVEALAFPLPVAIICELMGLDAADAPAVRVHSARIFGADQQASDDAVTWMRSYMEDALLSRRPNPEGDLLERMLAADDGTDSAFAHQEIVDNAVLLFFGGFETTRHLIASGAWALAHRPDQFRLLRGPDVPGLAVEELLRYDSPVRSVSGMVTEPVPVGDRVIKAGQVLILLLGSANHDESVFHEPWELDVLRQPNPHVSFGGGPHRCLGMHLARMEAQVVFRRLAERLETLEPAGTAVRARSSLNTYSDIPIRATPRSS